MSFFLDYMNILSIQKKFLKSKGEVEKIVRDLITSE